MSRKNPSYIRALENGSRVGGFAIEKKLISVELVALSSSMRLESLIDDIKTVYLRNTSVPGLCRSLGEVLERIEAVRAELEEVVPPKGQRGHLLARLG